MANEGNLPQIMISKYYIFNFILILLFLILFRQVNKELYYIFNILIYTYTLTNLYIRMQNYNKCVWN